MADISGCLCLFRVGHTGHFAIWDILPSQQKGLNWSILLEIDNYLLVCDKLSVFFFYLCILNR